MWLTRLDSKDLFQSNSVFYLEDFNSDIYHFDGLLH